MSSKYSPKEKISRKLEQSIEEHLSSLAVSEKDDLSQEEIETLGSDLFEFAEYDEKEAERTGYSNYSYWRSTVRMFFKNKVAVSMLAIMLILLVFTFIQPLLPNQHDPNEVNYYENALWMVVEEDGDVSIDGVKLTKGDLIEGEEGILTYVKTPKSWGTPLAYVEEQGGTPTEIALTQDPQNAGWYYVFVPDEMPYLYVTSEDGAYTTLQPAVWVTVDDKNLVYTQGTKLTLGDLVENTEANCVLAYVTVPESWGVPQINAGTISLTDTGSPLEVHADPENPGWYYVFVPSDTPMLTVISEDGSMRGGNKALARLSPTEIVLETSFVKNKAPNSVYWFGTDSVGRDLWARMWGGTRTSLLIGLIVAGIEAVVGILIGLLWGYVRKLDFFLTELYNVINNIPSTIILILASYIMRPGVVTLIVAMSITSWIGLARFIRNQVLIIRDRDFNLASRCLGTPTRRVIVKNLLPHMVSVVMLRMALAIPGAIGSEVFMAYIGLGLPLDTPSLGNLVERGRGLMMAPTLRYQLIVPAIILSVITICFYLVGNAFSDAADPKNHI